MAYAIGNLNPHPLFQYSIGKWYKNKFIEFLFI